MEHSGFNGSCQWYWRWLSLWRWRWLLEKSGVLSWILAGGDLLQSLFHCAENTMYSHRNSTTSISWPTSKSENRAVISYSWCANFILSNLHFAPQWPFVFAPTRTGLLRFRQHFFVATADFFTASFAAHFPYASAMFPHSPSYLPSLPLLTFSIGNIWLRCSIWSTKGVWAALANLCKRGGIPNGDLKCYCIFRKCPLD